MLNDISCPTATDCVAVGYVALNSQSGGLEQTLIEAWDGSRWQLMPSPNQDRTGLLAGVSCTSPENCMAVGFYYTSSGQRSLIERWDGRVWSVVPNPGGTGSELHDVSCIRPTNCTAVGYVQGSPTTLVEVWNGRTWSIVPSPSAVGSEVDFLEGVDCVSSTSCTAVGSSDVGNTNQTLVEVWNGRKWTLVPTTLPPASTQSLLEGVSCVRSNDCTAVGAYSTASNQSTFETLIEVWDGSTWSIVPSPNPTIFDGLQDVSCINSASCTAVGYSTTTQFGDGAVQTLVESLNGATWSIVPSPTIAAGGILQGVTCPSATLCAAVGRSLNGTGTQTLIEAGVIGRH